jgi:hypothetical protein
MGAESLDHGRQLFGSAATGPPGSLPREVVNRIPDRWPSDECRRWFSQKGRRRGAVHRDLVAYAEVLGRTTGQSVSDPTKIIVPMIEHFMATDRAFMKTRWGSGVQPAATERSG